MPGVWLNRNRNNKNRKPGVVLKIALQSRNKKSRIIKAPTIVTQLALTSRPMFPHARREAA
jgi:hypothetical protein